MLLIPPLPVEPPSEVDGKLVDSPEHAKSRKEPARKQDFIIVEYRGKVPQFIT